MSFFKFWFPVILYSAIIFYVSSLQRVETPLSGIHFDKILHVFEYAPFGFLLTRALFKTNRTLTGKSLFGFVVLGAFLYGLSDEYHQSFVVGRSATIIDSFADTIGGAVGSLIYLGVVKKSLV